MAFHTGAYGQQLPAGQPKAAHAVSRKGAGGDQGSRGAEPPGDGNVRLQKTDSDRGDGTLQTFVNGAEAPVSQIVRPGEALVTAVNEQAVCRLKFNR